MRTFSPFSASHSRAYVLFYFLIACILLATHTILEAKPKPSMPNNESVNLLSALPSAYRESKFKEVEQAFESRWNLFVKGKQFKKYSPNKSAAEIEEEFKHLSTVRLQTCFVDPKAPCLVSKAEYMIAQDLLEKDFFRAPNTIAFEYNRTDPTYNSSIIVVSGFRFIALEGPTSAFVKRFFTLLQNHQVTHLVRLTPAKEKGIVKVHPYWVGNTKQDATTGDVFLKVPQFKNRTPYNLRYYALNTWNDHQGVSEKTLLNLILKVRKHYEPSNNLNLLATHCVGGIGRTGTFLAGYVLLDEIDKQIALGISPSNIDISIEKTVLQLSLQRSSMVAKNAQYVTLYRLVDLYLTTNAAKRL